MNIKCEYGYEYVCTYVQYVYVYEIPPSGPMKYEYEHI